MALYRPTSPARAVRPFGAGLRDSDLRLLVASTDVRYRQTLRAVIVRRSERGPQAFQPCAAELVVVNTAENIAVLQSEAHTLDPTGRLASLSAGEITDISLESATTGERVMITAVSSRDFERIEAISRLEQIHISASPEDRGSWVCRMIDADRLDPLFSGRIIDIRQH